MTFLGVIIAVAASMAIGMIWYSPNMYGKTWRKLTGISASDVKKAKKKGMGPQYVVGFIASIVMAIILSDVVSVFRAETLLSGAITGFWMWLGFVATVMIGTLLWEKKPFQLYAINTGYWLVSLLVMGAVLAVW